MSGLRIKKGDRVRVLQGKDRGKEGSVTRVLPADGKVIVEGVNIAKKHQKPTRRTMQGGIIDKAYEIMTRSKLTQPNSACGSKAVASA